MPAQIAEAVARAKRKNKRVLIQWGANWCGWCHLLHGTFNENPEVARKLLYEYDVVLVDIGKWDKNLELAEKYGADFKNNGVPYLTILDADGKVLDTYPGAVTGAPIAPGASAAYSVDTGRADLEFDHFLVQVQGVLGR